MSRYYVGQELWRHDVNGDRRGGPTRVTIAKIGRKYVTTEGRFGQGETYEIESGRRNDKFRHSWLCTDEQHAEHLELAEALGRLKSLGLSFDFGRSNDFPAAAIHAACDALTTTPAPTPAHPSEEADRG